MEINAAGGRVSREVWRNGAKAERRWSLSGTHDVWCEVLVVVVVIVGDGLFVRFRGGYELEASADRMNRI